MKPFLKSKEKDRVNGQCLGTYTGYGMQEELYRKENGEFILVGKGGPSTKYAVHCCGTLIGGSKLTPLSLESAQHWGKERLSEEDYRSLFPKEGDLA